ncbi:hypothetical protein, partial [Agrobacterium cavarae]|uniref:hypothetical protein n=1 Tax=Agrobacterium cavarae TaxID=2528239 RepID=UPI002FD8DF42
SNQLDFLLKERALEARFFCFGRPFKDSTQSLSRSFRIAPYASGHCFVACPYRKTAAQLCLEHSLSANVFSGRSFNARPGHGCRTRVKIRGETVPVELNGVWLERSWRGVGRDNHDSTRNHQLASPADRPQDPGDAADLSIKGYFVHGSLKNGTARSVKVLVPSIN